jgi:hypothetical protein
MQSNSPELLQKHLLNAFGKNLLLGIVRSQDCC